MKDRLICTFLVFLMMNHYFMGNYTTEKNNQLSAVFVIWRHGDRAPYQPHVSDMRYWPEGKGVLTNKGIQEAYELGEYLANKLDSLIPKSYDPKYYYLRSSDVDRTLKSGAANAAAFFKNDKITLTEYAWRPVPVHTTDHEREYLFSNYICDDLYKQVDDVYRGVPAEKFLLAYEETLKSIDKNLGFKFDVRNLEYLYDEILCNRIHQFDLPEWIIPKIERDLEEISYHFLSQWVDSFDKISFQVGIFAREYVDHIRELIRTGRVYKDIDARKMLLAPNHIMAFSGHDVNIRALTAMLGVPVIMPHYSSCLMLNLIGPDFPGNIHDYKILAKYKAGANDSMEVILKLPFCEKSLCPAQTVLDHIEKYALTVDQYLAKCKLPNVPKKLTGGQYLAIIAGSFIGLGIVIVIISYFIKKRIMNQSI